MEVGTGAFLVVRRDDGYGDIYPLQAGLRHKLGRAHTNRIVLKDELSSREHAEVYFAEDGWRLRDLKSLNGTKINGDPLDGEWDLISGDEVQVGRTKFVFVHQIDELPAAALPAAGGAITVIRRMHESRYPTPPPDPAEEVTPDPYSRRSRSSDMMYLYRIALGMGAAESYQQMAEVVLDGLMQAVPAEVGAILTVIEGRQTEITAVHPRDLGQRVYAPASEFLTHEVLASGQAVLAEDVARSRYLSQRDSLTQLGATSLICAPVRQGGKTYALIHLYCTDPHKALTTDDLEFAVAVSKHMGVVVSQFQRADLIAAENRELRDQLRVETAIVGDSDPVHHILEQVSRVAGTTATVLIRGESGVGKELVARAIHLASPRKVGPFVCLNCAAITETLLESELFGHEKGAFTGATEKKIGKFEASHHGTIFLDEIGEMTFSTQAKLLRVLEGHPFERVGGSTPIRVDVRVVAATNQPLEKAIQEGRFRRDLFYRLQVVEIRVPALRERRLDIPLLAEHFLRRFVRETGRKLRGFTPLAMQHMEKYDWPGNVRELRNVVERAVALGRGPYLDLGDLRLTSPDDLTETVPSDALFEPLPLDEVEKRHIQRTLEYTDWNKSQAAGILKIERSTLDRKIKSYHLKKDE